MCTQRDAIAILREAALRCGLIYDGHIRDAYLYGSYARGDYHAGSDVDILLTADASNDEISRHRDAVAHVSSELSLANDVTVSLTMATNLVASGDYCIAATRTYYAIFHAMRAVLALDGIDRKHHLSSR